MTGSSGRDAHPTPADDMADLLDKLVAVEHALRPLCHHDVSLPPETKHYAEGRRDHFAEFPHQWSQLFISGYVDAGRTDGRCDGLIRLQRRRDWYVPPIRDAGEHHRADW
jgi:hypothetical protein